METAVYEDPVEESKHPSNDDSEPSDQDGEPEEDPDLVFARLLQSQEAAYMMLRYSSRNRSREADDQDANENVLESEARSEDEEDEDAAVARQIQEEEEREFQMRLLALAGINVPGGAEEDVDGESEEGAMEEVEGRGLHGLSTVETDDMSYEQLLELQEMIGHESRGASSRAIDSLRISSFGEVCTGSEEVEAGHEQVCAICQCEFDEEDQLKILKCMHFYHTECIVQWLNINKVCPVCNHEVTEEEAA